MLKTTKTITLNGHSCIDDEIVVYMNASVSTENFSSNGISTSIANHELYNSHRSEIRKDISAFQQQAYEVEDALFAELIEVTK